MSRPVEATPSLSQQAYERIRRDVLWCALAPGSEVTESGLAERYEFGKAPIRSALARLAEQGLVHPLPHRGYLIDEITLRDADELFQMRLILEPAAARLAAGRVDDAARARLEHVMEASYSPGDRESEAAFLEANRDFHVALAALSGNGRLTAAIAELLDRTNRIFHLGLALSDRSVEFRHGHGEIIAAITEGDGERAAELLTNGISGSREMVLAALISSPSLRDVSVQISNDRA